MAGQPGAWYRRRRVHQVWPLAVVVVLALGLWGFSDLRATGPGATALSRVEVLYRTLRLFALEFDLPRGTRAPWQLWCAAFAAPALTLRGIAELFREQIAGVVTHHLVRPRIVLFGANERSAALIAQLELSGPSAIHWAYIVRRHRHRRSSASLQGIQNREHRTCQPSASR